MSAAVRVEVHPDRDTGEVSPFIYGHFTEHLVNVVHDGMWAELVFGRKFETPMVGRLAHPIADPWRAFDPEAGQITYWRGPGPTPRHAPSHGDCHHSQSVSFLPGHGGGEQGITAPDIRLDAGATYTFRAKLRRTGPIESVRVALRTIDGEVAGETTLTVEPIGQTMFADLSFSIPTLLWMDPISWQEVTGTITVDRTDHDGVLSLTVEVPAGEEATIWFDWVSLMPADAVDGWHRGVSDALEALPARMLKWPGGCMADDYDWRLGVGPRDSRHCAMDRAWLGWDENDVGTDEFLELCERTGIEPYLGVNAGSGSPELAASWVEYVNGPITSEWGALRAANGHPEPYNVRYWSVGNEQWGHFERGYVGPVLYAERFLRFAEAMRKVDPSITLVAVGKNGPFNAEVLPLAGSAMDLLQIHHYAPEIQGDTPQAATDRILAARTFDTEIAKAMAQITAADAGGVRIALDEWGWGRENHAGALFNAVALNAMQRAGDAVALGSRSCVVNADGVVTRAGERVTRNDVYEIFSHFSGAHLPRGILATTDDEVLDVSALADPATGDVSVFIVNTATEAVTVEVGGLQGSAAVTLIEAGPDGPWGRSAPPATATTEGTLDLPPHSLAVVRGRSRD